MVVIAVGAGKYTKTFWYHWDSVWQGSIASDRIPACGTPAPYKGKCSVLGLANVRTECLLFHLSGVSGWSFSPSVRNLRKSLSARYSIRYALLPLTLLDIRRLIW